ncbi:MAG: nucleotidyltransferase family protein, partial [Bacteroidetes bacterium]|nr:nucleotidyltransferase family protein [Bacteroidota bacterium]
MIGVILAAGISSRLRPLTDTTPKSLLPVGGRPLLQRSLEALCASDIRRCVIVTGYRREMIERFVAKLCLPLDISFV